MKRKFSGGGASAPFKKPRLVRQNALVSFRASAAGSQGILDELKYNDAAVVTDVTTTPVIVDLNNFAAGDTAIQRDGNKIMMKSLDIRLNFTLEAITQNATCRFVVVLDKNANTVAPTWSGAAASSVFDAATIESQRQVSTMGRFVILMDKTFCINQSASNAGGVQHFFFKKYVKIAPKYQLVTYAANTAAVPVTNGLSLMYISDVAAGITDVNVAGTTRLRFVG